VAIFVLSAFLLFVLFLGWSCCAVSGRISEAERQRELVDALNALGWQEWPCEDASAKGGA
jgi:hypothetical protein